jgi:hypothetical protein
MNQSGAGAFPNAAVKPLAVSVNTARRLLGIGNTLMWELIKDKRVETTSIGRRRLVIFASLEKLVADRTK